MRILIVDDIFTNRLLLSQILRNLEVDFDEVKNGMEAITALESRDYDVVLMDIEMPKMNGIETTLYIRREMASPINRIPIVALTAHDPVLFFKYYKDVGFDKLLTKPYSVEKLSVILKELES
jgi:CheY-like chemotaxis protein